MSKSRHANLFVLKGALMLVAWRVPILRATRDIDLLARTRNDLESIKTIMSEICREQVPDDGIEFAPDSVTTTRIAEDADYQGVRAQFHGLLATTRLAMQIDMGFSDVVTPEPIEIVYPTILDYPPPILRAYNRETAIAEKFEAMVSLGWINSRMKDFFDIWLLATTTDFHGADLQAAISATFRRRETPLTPEPQAFTLEFALDSSKQLQWAGFLKRMRPSDAPEKFSAVVDMIRRFLQPINERLLTNGSFSREWRHPGPWQPATE